MSSDAVPTLECSVCVGTCTSGLTCPHCAYFACRGCCTRYWEEHPLGPPSCMSCRAVLTNAQLETAFSKTWVRKTLEDARRAALVRADQAHSLATQTTIMPLVRLLEVGVLPAVQKALVDLKAEEEKLTACEYARWAAKRDITIGIGAQAALKAADESVKAQAAPVKACKAALEERVKVAEDLMVLLSLDDLANVATRFRRVVVSHEDVLNTLSGVDGLVQSIMDRLVPGEPPAPGAMSAAPAAPAPAVRLHLCSAAGCKGSFDSVAGTCMVCQAAHCVRCMQPLPAGGGNGAGPAVEHRCNPADVATARYVAASTTACPRCHTAISRISGCAQMLCTHCYAVFDFDTGRETAGIIHNPHFYSLSAELRQKVSDERAARGLSGQASGARNRAAPIACDADAEHDPLCVPFESPIFLALLEARFKDKDRDSVLEAHQLASDYVYRAPRVEERLHASINFGELRARAARITYLRGGRRIAKVVTMPMTNHPLGYKSESVFVAGLDADGAGDTASASRVYGRFLMTVDTERSKVASRLELMRTYADVAQDQLRLLLVAGSGELPVLLAQVNHLRCKTVALLIDLESEGGSYAKKRRTEARQKAEKAEADLAAALAAAAPARAGGPSLIVASSQPLMQSQPTAAAPQGADESDSGGDDDGGKRPSDGELDDAAASGSGDEEEGGRNKRARRA